MFDENKCEQAVRLLLESLGEDVNRPGLIDTPRRVAGYWKELTEGINYSNQDIANKFNKNFDVGYDPIVTVYMDNIYSHCEHH